VWGVLDRDLATLPGYGKPADMKDKARKLLAEAGYGPGKPLRVEMVTRAIAVYVDMASFVINELKQVGIEATLKQVETAQWHPMATRGDYQIGANLTGLGVDDPDANFYENFACGSPRNYSFYCNEQVMKLIDQQSMELDPAKRLALVVAVQKQIELDAARPTLDQRLDYFTVWPHVKNMVPHNNIFNFGRMQNVWREK
jgi:peptide/nickel transport system substrate-binding protein